MTISSISLRFLCPVVALLLATACQPAVETKVTQDATGTPTLPPTATLTPTPEASPTSTPSATPTPDVRVVDVDPRDMLLSRVELPPEGKWYLIELTPHHNSEVISVRGLDEGNKYVRLSGRVDSWYSYYEKGTNHASVPDNIQIQVTLFRDANGPIYIMDEGRGPCKAQPAYTSLWPDMDVVSADIGFGDASQVCITKEMQPDGYYVEYKVNVAHRNVAVTIYARGPEDRFTLDWLSELARLQYAKVAEQPLTDSVTFSP